MGKKHCSNVKRTHNETAVSEVIGSILLVAIVVTAASIVGVVLWSQPSPEQIPALDVVISEDTGNKIIHLYNDGGDPLDREDFTIRVDGNDSTDDFTKSGISEWSVWVTGESLDYNYAGTDPKVVQIIYNGFGSSIVLAAAYF